jgi:hypothetical protein
MDLEAGRYSCEPQLTAHDSTRGRPSKNSHMSLPSFRSSIQPPDGPVVIGGVGGSGTRVVAEILQHLGVYMGADINPACDNWWFTMLGKLPRWDLSAALEPDSPTMHSFGVIEKAMTGRLRPNRTERRLIADIRHRCLDVQQRDPLPDDRSPEWLDARTRSLLGSRRIDRTSAAIWGWKEPNSQLFVPHLHRYFGGRLRYIQVVRNGLHMAYSKNQHQVRRWGPEFGVHVQSERPTPQESLDYWIRSNESAILHGNEMPSGHFMILRYDELCAAPRAGVEEIIAFLGLDAPEDVVEEAASLPRMPNAPAIPLQDLELQFDQMQLTRVRTLGFPISGFDSG